MDLYAKNIGILGFGIVGKSALKLLSRYTNISVYDQRELTAEEHELIASYNGTLYSADRLDEFLDKQQLIVPSPGIDIRPYQQHRHKFISELDLFYLHCKAPIIAITGTVGKTSVTGLLAHALEHIGYTVCVGGNIGVGMLELLDDEHNYDYAIVEVSSFQLELSRHFAPHIALWTNFYPNHLDRHETMMDYFSAKQNILLFQQERDVAILPFEIIDLLNPQTRGQRIFFTTHPLADHEQRKLRPADKVLSIQKDTIVLHNERTLHVIELDKLPSVTYQQNLLAVLGVLVALSIPADQLLGATTTFVTQEHRLEKVATINGVDFYNDSKSTIAQSTLAAIDKLQGQPILLLVGGLSKGVDRSTLFQDIKDKVSEVFCFGKEADELYKAGTAAHVTCHRFDHLETALQSAVVSAKPGDRILFSPAGSSFDLFSNYQERGKKFKELVYNYQL